LLSWIWGLGNRVWISLLTFVPFIGWVMPFVLGFKGREWAWKAKNWESVEHFNRVQRKWSIAGLILLLVSIVLVIVIMAVSFSSVEEAMKEAEHEIAALQGDEEDTNLAALANPETVEAWAECGEMLQGHGYFSRAQFQCQFSEYSESIKNEAGACFAKMDKTLAQTLVETGMATFDVEAAQQGLDALCQSVLQEYPQVFRN